MKSLDLKTSRACAIKDNFRHIWDYKYEACMRKYFDKWYFWVTHSQIAPMVKAAKTLKVHIDNIVTYAKHRNSHGTAAFLWASTAVYQYFSDTLTTGVIKNCPDHVLTDKRSPITKNHYFDLKGRCISINNEPKNFQRQIPKIIITSDLNRYRPCITIKVK